MDAPPLIDRDAHRVAYTIAIQPGPQYHFKAVHLAGLSPAQLQALNSSWRMQPGDIYDASYLSRFLGQSAQAYLHTYMVALDPRRNPADLTVDLTVTFSPNTPPPRPN